MPDELVFELEVVLLEVVLPDVDLLDDDLAVEDLALLLPAPELPETPVLFKYQYHPFDPLSDFRLPPELPEKLLPVEKPPVSVFGDVLELTEVPSVVEVELEVEVGVVLEEPEEVVVVAVNNTWEARNSPKAKKASVTIIVFLVLATSIFVSQG